MIWLLWLVFGLIVASFCWALRVGYRSRQEVGPKKWIAGLVLLLPHLILVVCITVCIVLTLSCGAASPGSPCFNAQFLYSTLVMFILPIPALIGTSVALRLFKRHR